MSESNPAQPPAHTAETPKTLWKQAPKAWLILAEGIGHGVVFAKLRGALMALGYVSEKKRTKGVTVDEPGDTISPGSIDAYFRKAFGPTIEHRAEIIAHCKAQASALGSALSDAELREARAIAIKADR